MAAENGLDLIRNLVADRLDVEVTTVRAESRLLTDLGADSLDFLDLVFSLEDRFKIKLRGSELSFLTRLGSADPGVIRDGVLTAEAMARLAGVLPELASTATPLRITPRELFGMITVGALWRVVSTELARQSGGDGA